MKEKNIIREKSFAFSIHIIQLYKKLAFEKKEYVLSKQLLRSGTSVGANIEEAIGGQSTKDFLHKISISYKESRESIYWIKLLIATDYLSIEESKNILHEAEDICRIIGKIQIAIKKKLGIL